MKRITSNLPATTPATTPVIASDPAQFVIEARSLDYRYPDGTTALEEINFQVRAGDIVAVLGPSGAGKSTLFRCLAGLQNPARGSVHLDGVDLQRHRGSARRRALAQIGLVFQEFHLVARASVLSNVLIGRLHQARLIPSLLHLTSRRDRQVAAELLINVGLGAQIRKRADALSGGQRQRVALARALAQQPRVLLADEPVANLDPALAASVVRDIVRMVTADGLTAVLNLHDVDLARRVARRIVGMQDGRIIFDLPTEQVTDVLLEQLYGGQPQPTHPPTAPSLALAGAQ